MGAIGCYKIGKFDFLHSKSMLDKSLKLVFCENDIIIEKRKDEEGVKYDKVILRTTVKKVCERLNTLGFTLNKCEKYYINNVYDNIVYVDSQFNDDEKKWIKFADEHFSFEKWSVHAKDYACFLKKNGYPRKETKEGLINKNTDLIKKVIIDEMDIYSIASEGFFGLDWNFYPMYALRIILEAFGGEEEIFYDLTFLIDAGWVTIGEVRDLLNKNSKIIVVTEGSTDKNYLEKSMKKFFSHLYDCFSFLDFNLFEIDGGVSFVSKYVKALASIKIENRVIGIFDNDTIGILEYNKMKKKNFPANINLITLPNLDFCNSYPTYDFNNNLVNQNINGKAVSIELFLPSSIIKNEINKYIPIRWNSYQSEAQKYQGAICDKGAILKKFNKKIKLNISFHEWDNIKSLLEFIIKLYD